VGPVQRFGRAEGGGVDEEVISESVLWRAGSILRAWLLVRRMTECLEEQKLNMCLISRDKSENGAKADRCTTFKVRLKVY
jgi:hypothetical protein